MGVSLAVICWDFLRKYFSNESYRKCRQKFKKADLNSKFNKTTNRRRQHTTQLSHHNTTHYSLYNCNMSMRYDTKIRFSSIAAATVFLILVSFNLFEFKFNSDSIAWRNKSTPQIRTVRVAKNEEGKLYCFISVSMALND